jgi:hypothetical protein
MHRLIVCCVLTLVSCAAPAMAQFKQGDPGGTKEGVAQAHKWKVGIVITAVAGPSKAIEGYVPVPMEWPEQTVRVVEQDVSPGVKVTYQTLGESAKLMVVRLAFLPAGATAKAVVTFEINRSMQLKPDDKAGYEVAAAKKLTPALRRYLGSSPRIEVQNAAIRKAAKEVGVNAANGWDRVEALYDWMRTKVSYKTGSGAKGAAAALKDGFGNHDDMSSLFVALCRSAGIPARMVWVPQFSYAEFYLLDKKGEGHWLPCSPAGTKAFGEMLETKPVLAKGDNFVLPTMAGRNQHESYIAEFLNAQPGSPQAGRPSVQWVKDMGN